MKIKLNRVIFENKLDVVDCVTKGLPPSKRDFKDLMNSISHDKIPNGVNISSDDEFKIIMHRVYKNNRRKAVFALGIIGTATIAFGLYKIISHIKEEREMAEFNDEIDSYFKDTNVDVDVF